MVAPSEWNERPVVIRLYFKELGSLIALFPSLDGSAESCLLIS